MFNLSTLLFAACLLFMLMYLVADKAEKSSFPKSVIDHPFTYILSLGSYAGIWVIFGATGSAQMQGYSFMAYYFGTAMLFVFSPLVLQPILNLSRTHRLSSLADLFSYRYNSRWAGAIVALGTIMAIIPLMVLQMTTLTEASAYLIGTHTNSQLIPILLSISCIFFAIRFGAKSHNIHDRHNGLMIMTAGLSLFKLLVILIIGCAAIIGVFGSIDKLALWLGQHPEKLELLNTSLNSNNVRSMMLIFFAAALVMPHTFHLIFTENRKPQNIHIASWGFPVYLLLLSLPVLPILWAVESQSLDKPAAYLFTAVVGVILESKPLTLLAWLAGFSASAGMMVIILVTVSSICTNHLLLPFSPPVQKINAFAWLRFMRALLITLLCIGVYLLHLYFAHDAVILEQFSYAAYIAAFQFLPGILSVLFWPRANSYGVVAGLITGFCVWIVIIVMPLASNELLGLKSLLLDFVNGDSNYWITSAVASLGLNMLVTGVVSLCTKTNEEERLAAETCAQEKLNLPNPKSLLLNNVPAFIDNLSKAMGPHIARREVEYALHSLSITEKETRPFALRLLRRQLEVNLSGLFGPTVARQIVNRHLPYAKHITVSNKNDIQLIEHRLERYPLELSGIAKELDDLRRYHRNTLEQLPIGIGTINSHEEILMWNQAIEDLTGIKALSVIGSKLSHLPAPWSDMLCNFVNSDQTSLHNQALELQLEQRWFTLHKANLQASMRRSSNRTFMLEETTNRVQLEKELLHTERLASIGRLAAGVAHEIGNPVTGIACLAQNLKYDVDQQAVATTAKDIITQTQRISRIVQSLVNFSHTGSHRQDFIPIAVNLYQCADDAIHLLSLDKDNATQLVENHIAHDALVAGDQQLLLQMLINLLKNALQVIDKNTGRIVLSSVRSAKHIDIVIEDNGPGIPEHLHSQIFEPFFTTKEAGEGTGLGLALVYSIMEDHDGHVSMQSPNPISGCGTCFTIRFQHLWS